MSAVPLVLESGSVRLRPPHIRDGRAWAATRRAQQEWLEPWEAVPPAAARIPWTDRQSISSWAAAVRALRRQQRQGESLPLVVLHEGRFAGQIAVGQLTRGALLSGSLGYWVDQRVAGRGLGSLAVALVVEHCLTDFGLHRVEAAVRPENARSRALLARLRFREEGLMERVLFTDGAWRDHLLLALTREERPRAGMLSLLPRDTPARLPEGGSGRA